MNKLNNFKLELLLEKREKSKDSHTDKYSLFVINNKVNYSWEHWGYPDQENKSKSFNLSEKKLEKLVEYIMNNKLNITIEENRKTDKMGLSISIDLKMEMDNKSSRIIINGMYNDWTKRDKENTSNIKHVNYCNTIESIITSIENDLDYF